MKNVLLLGDSIRQNYQPLTTEYLKDKANVYAPTDNCRFTTYTLINLDNWLKEVPKPDIIQWNNGIWDLTYFNGEKHPLTSLEDYLRDTKRICDRLKKTGATLIFALTTPLHPGKQRPNKSNDDIRRYNEAVAEMLKAEGVLINDLFTPVWADYDRYICDDGCHLSDEGKELCARLNAELMGPLLDRVDVLLLGDSIRECYMHKVKEELGDTARVSWPRENCKFAAYTLNMLRAWKEQFPNPDIIHWNNGAWDIVSYYGETTSFTSLEIYLDLLERIVKALRFLYGDHPKIIFALTTPPRDPAKWDLVKRYNDAARERLEPLGVKIDDLYSLILSDIPAYICHDGVHLSEEGKAAAGHQVAEIIRADY